jgi:hypothetical protein
VSRDHTLYHELIDVTSDYLGPAAQRFIDRQIVNHLEKPPEKLTSKDLERLNAWITSVVALLTQDENIINEYSGRLANLTNLQVK